jgi:PilZ domain
MEERRTKPRLTVSLEAVWDDTTGHHPARISNLSLGGCYLDTVGETRRGEIVCFRVLMPDDDWLYLEGEVRHHTAGMGFGVQFTDLDEQQLQKIEWLLRMARESGDVTTSIAANLVED